MKYRISGDEVSVDACIIQATVALDATGRLAQKARDTDKMMEVAEAWVKLADFMAALERTGHGSDEKEEIPFGFSTGATGERITLGVNTELADQLEIEFEDEEDARDDED